MIKRCSYCGSNVFEEGSHTAAICRKFLLILLETERRIVRQYEQAMQELKVVMESRHDWTYSRCQILAPSGLTCLYGSEHTCPHSWQPADGPVIPMCGDIGPDRRRCFYGKDHGCPTHSWTLPPNKWDVYESHELVAAHGRGACDEATCPLCEEYRRANPIADRRPL